MDLLRDVDDPRRRLLVKLLSAGALSTLPSRGRCAADIWADAGQASAGSLDLSAERAGHRQRRAATLSTRIGPTDTIGDRQGFRGRIRRRRQRVPSARIFHAESGAAVRRQRADRRTATADRQAAGRVSARQGASFADRHFDGRRPRHGRVVEADPGADLLLYLLWDHRCHASNDPQSRRRSSLGITTSRCTSWPRQRRARAFAGPVHQPYRSGVDADRDAGRSSTAFRVPVRRLRRGAQAVMSED